MLNPKTMDYQVRRSSRAKRPNLRVDFDGITVVLPEGSPMDPVRVIESNREWVEEKLRTIQARRQELPDRRFEPGATWPLLGEEKEIVVRDRRGRDLVGETIELPRSQVEKKSLADQLETFYREQARNRFEELLEKWCDELNVEYNKLYVRNQKTRWGSCSSKNNINLNWRLVLGPPELSDYVVLHEVVHLKQAGHGTSFRHELHLQGYDYDEMERRLEDRRYDMTFRPPEQQVAG